MKSLIDALRLRYGLRWNGARPALRENLKNIALLLGLLAAYAVAGRLDYEDELISQAEVGASRKAGE